MLTFDFEGQTHETTDDAPARVKLRDGRTVAIKWGETYPPVALSVTIVTAREWSPARALSALLRACATEAETPRDGESEADRVARVGGAAEQASSLCHTELDAVHLLMSWLHLRRDDTRRTIASVYEPESPTLFRVNAPRWQHRALTDPIAMSLHNMRATDAEAAAVYAGAIAQLKDDFSRYAMNDPRPLLFSAEPYGSEPDFLANRKGPK